MKRTVLNRISTMPTAISSFFFGMLGCGCYFLLSGVLELIADTKPLPLAPAWWFALIVGVINPLFAYGLFRAIGWVRLFVAVFPLVAYPIEYGAPGPLSVSLQTAELLALLPFAATAIYCLYVSRSGREWFAGV